MIICINGNIGSGKSTVLKKLQAAGFAVYFEGIDRGAWCNLLGKYYDNPKEYSYLFQTVVLADMKELYDMISSKHKENEIVFVERSHIDCLAFCKLIRDEGNMKEEEFEVFKRLLNLLYVSPDMHITIKVSPKICLDRLLYRGRGSETSVSLNYLEKVDKYTTECLNMGICVSKKYVIDGKGKSPNEVRDQILDIVNHYIS
jgi:deoxyadenosine/deoxycytidine kinase